MRRVIGAIRGATRKVNQLTGEQDRERSVPTVSRTQTRFGLFGTDLGASFEHNGRLWFLFGDTVSSIGYDDRRPEAGDSIAWTDDRTPEDGLRLNFLTAPDNHYLSPRVQPAIPQGPFNVPLDGFSANGHLYVWFSTDADLQAAGGVKMGRSVLTRLADEQQALFTNLYTLSDFRQGGKFINVSTSIVDNAALPGLPDHEGQGLIIVGSGAYRASNPYLAYLPLNDVENRAKVRYWAGGTGSPVWSADERDAVALFEQPQIGELSVRFIPQIGGWVMLYNAADPRGITMRTAPWPWGPWSPGTVIFDPWCDGGYARFIHASWAANGRADAVHDPDRENEWGGEYGPYLIPQFTTVDRSDVTLYFVMSTWNPYNTVLMRAGLHLDPWRGWYTLGGATFPPSAPLAAVSRDPARMEVWSVDDHGSVRGNWFDNTWRGWYTLGGATFPPGAHVTVVSRDPARMEVWSVDDHGSVRGNWFDNTWRGWYTLGGATFPPGAHVTVVSRDPARMEVWAVDVTGTVRGNWFDNTWRGWYTLSGATFPPGAPLTAVSRDPTRMELWAVDTTGVARGNWYDKGWQGWYPLDGATFPAGANLKAVTRHPERMEVWAVDPTGLARGDWFDGS